MSNPLSQDQNLQDFLSEEVLKIPADYAEIRAEEADSTSIIYKGNDPESILEPASSGFFIRVLINGSWGITTFTDLALLPEKITEAIAYAKLQGKGSVKLAETLFVQTKIIPQIKKDFRGVPLKEKVALVKKYNNLLLKSSKGIQTTTTVYQDKYLTKYFVNNKGSKILQIFPYIRLVYQAMGEHKGVVEMHRGSKGHVGGFEIVKGLEEDMVKVAKEALKTAQSPKIKGGQYTVILDPYMAGTFAHEAFGHLSEADHQYENPELLKLMQIGKKIGSEKVTIIDDPALPSGWGNYTYDDEGVLAKKINLLTNGVISERLHSLETAGKLNEIPNGRARADGFSSKPVIRMSNTYFQKGKESLNNLISETKSGLLVVSWLAGMTAMESFTFTGMYGIKIEGGKLTERVRGVKLLGNVFETLKNIDGVSNDFLIDEGTCGKEGQRMPVGSGGGYVRIQNVTVGGV